VIEIEPVGPLRDPVLVAAFEGWNDAADAASGVVDHLLSVWESTLVAVLDPEDFYDFQVNRPLIETDEHGHRRITWPSTQLSVVSPPGSLRDVVLLRGIEPNMRWRGFCEELVDFAHELDVHTVVCLAALLADVPHSRPIEMHGSASDEALAETLGLTRSRYEGPTGVVSVFHEACARAGLKVVTFWASVPHYVAQPPCPKATLSLLHRAEDALDIAIPLGDLPEQARAWEHGVDELAREDSEIAEYIASLEDRESETELPEASGDAIAKAFERYLRRRDNPST
jgi:hypothetical protein